MNTMTVQPGYSTHGANGNGVGTFGGYCNRLSACSNTGATWYNRGSGAFYCGICAEVLNRANARYDQMSDGKPMCILVTVEEYNAFTAQFDRPKPEDMQPFDLIRDGEIDREPDKADLWFALATAEYLRLLADSPVFHDGDHEAPEPSWLMSGRDKIHLLMRKLLTEREEMRVAERRAAAEPPQEMVFAGALPPDCIAVGRADLRVLLDAAEAGARATYNMDAVAAIRRWRGLVDAPVVKGPTPPSDLAPIGG